MKIAELAVTPQQLRSSGGTMPARCPATVRCSESFQQKPRLAEGITQALDEIFQPVTETDKTKLGALRGNSRLA